MTNFILVPSPLVGPETWTQVVTVLEAPGHRCTVVDLRSTLDEGPRYFARQVALIGPFDGDEVILVGHSGAGTLLGAAARSNANVRGCVFVDAVLPRPGRSFVEEAPVELVAGLRAMAREGWLPPWSSWWGPDGLDQIVRDPILRDGFIAGCRPVPFAMLEELHPAGASLPDVRAAYVGLSEGYADEVELARTLGWPVAELDLDHLAPVSEPNKVAIAIEHVVAQWGAA